MGGIGHIRDQQQGRREPKVARPALGQAQGGGATEQRGHQQQRPLGTVGIGIGPKKGGTEHDHEVTGREHQSPDQCGMGHVIHHHGDKVGVKDSGEHDRGVARIGEIQAGPGENLSPGHGWIRQNA